MNLKVSGYNIGYGDTGFIFSKQSTKIWADDVCEAAAWAFYIRFSLGVWLRPIRKFWLKDNVWTSGKHWFVLNSRYRVPGVLISLSFFGYHFYIGTKTYGVDWPRYESWLDKKYIDDNNQALAPSASVRTS